MLTKITPTRGESLLIWRRRHGLRQPQAAKHYGATMGTYRDWEAGRRKHDQPRLQIGVLKDHEKCYLLRRRANKLQREIAEEIGVTRLWVIRMEEGSAPIDRLGVYWESKQCQN